jgi:CheY-specific phosphatase CheX
MSERKNMQEADSQALRECVFQCAQDVFASCSIPAEFAEGNACDGAKDGQVAAFIGFGGAHAQGMLTIIAPFTLLCEAHPIPGEGGKGPNEADVLDWAGEIANLLLGRIRNKVAQRGLDLQISTPKSMLASHMWIKGATSSSICVLRSDAESDGTIGVWLDAVLEDGVHFKDLPAVPNEAVAEGDELFF